MSYQNSRKQIPVTKKSTKFPRSVLVATSIVAMLIAGAAIWWFAIRDSGPKAVNGVIPASNPRESDTNTDPQTTPAPADPTPTVPSTKTPSDPAEPTATTLDKAPEGSFVSNHKPSLSGASAPSAEQSACNTTPGATCYISFSKDGVTRTLPVKTANADGFVIWNWDVKDAGLTAGTWQISAIATLGSQTKTTKDTIGLEVAP